MVNLVPTTGTKLLEIMPYFGFGSITGRTTGLPPLCYQIIIYLIDKPLSLEGLRAVHIIFKIQLLKQ